MSRFPDSLERTPRRALEPTEVIEYNQAEGPTAASLIRTLRKRLRLFLGVFISCFVSFSIVTFCLPKKYQAEMKLLVKNDRQDAIISAQANTSVLRSSDVSETQVNSEIELIRSRDVLRDVVLRLNLAQEIEKTNASEARQPFSARLDSAVDQMGKTLAVIAIKKTDVIDVSYTSRDPRQAAAVLRTLSEIYLQKHLSVHGAFGLSSFFDEQAVKYRGKLAAAENELRLLREHSPAMVTPEEKEALMQQALEAEASLESINAEISDHKERLAKTRQDLGGLRARVLTTERTAANQQLEGALVQTLTELQNKRTQMVMKFRPDDRMVTELDEEIARTSAALNAAKHAQSVEQATDINPVRQNAEKDAVSEHTALAGLEAKRDVFRSTVADYKQKLFVMAAMSEQNDDLTRKVKEYEDNYLLYSKKGEEARIADALDRQRVANISVVQAAAVPQKASSPRTLLDLALGFICALFLASVAVMIIELITAADQSNLPIPSDRLITAAEEKASVARA
jgi:uncharacterized protein involved in exopolysaccharide biosynthesis